MIEGGGWMSEAVVLATPFLLLGSTHLTFNLFARLFGPRLGYFLGFVFYWVVWCFLVPWWVLGTSGLLAVFRHGPHPFGRPLWLGAMLIAAPLVLGYGYAFPRAVRGTTPSVVVASFALAAVNSTLEELLWRGVYVSIFPNSLMLGVVYPALGFGLWHLAPQVVSRNRHPGGKWSLVAVSAVLGLAWGWVAFSAASILATSVSHLLFDFSGLGAGLYVRAPAESRPIR